MYGRVRDVQLLKFTEADERVRFDHRKGRVVVQVERLHVPQAGECP